MLISISNKTNTWPNLWCHKSLVGWSIFDSKNTSTTAYQHQFHHLFHIPPEFTCHSIYGWHWNQANKSNKNSLSRLYGWLEIESKSVAIKNEIQLIQSIQIEWARRFGCCNFSCQIYIVFVRSSPNERWHRFLWLSALLPPFYAVPLNVSFTFIKLFGNILPFLTLKQFTFQNRIVMQRKFISQFPQVEFEPTNIRN